MQIFDNQRLTEFPNRLCEPASPPPRLRATVVGLLLLVCLLPRLWVGLQQESICPDAVQYVDIADALQEGNHAGGFAYLNLNIYPLILLVLRQTGQHWAIACGGWSLLMSTLAVLPLYGLLRRQLGQRVAVLACLLYALHPRLILYSPLILRDPTFWFCFLSALYLQWRAVTELRWWLFLSAGVAMFLAIHTRSEGWLLLIPLAIWGVRRLCVLSQTWRLRWRLIGGLSACLAVSPLMTVLVNVTLLRDQPQWQTATTRHFVYAWLWLQGERDIDATMLGTLPPPASETGDAAPAPNAGSPLLPPPTMKVHQRLVVRFVKAFTYAYGVILLAGIWCLRRNLWRSDTLPFFFVTLVMFFGIWIRYNVLPIDERYYFTILLASLPTLAVGGLQITEWVAALFGVIARRGADCQSASQQPAPWQPAPRPAALLVLLLVVAVLSAMDAVRVGGAMFHAWQEQADLGQWILRERGPRQPLTGNNEEMRLAAYYAQGYLVRLDWTQLCSPPSPSAEPAVPPSVIVFWDDRRHEPAPNRCQQLLSQRHDVPYRQVPASTLPPSCRDLTVLVHLPAVSCTTQSHCASLR